jgi:hypothetical protein
MIETIAALGSGAISFLGGTAFRWLAGEALAFFKAKQEHAYEIAMRELDHKQDGQRAQWRREEIKSAADAGVQMISAKSESDARGMADSMLLETITQIGKQTGIGWVDAWNQSIRPALATASIVLLIGNAIWPGQIVLNALTMEVVCAVLGVFVGGRINATGR